MRTKALLIIAVVMAMSYLSGCVNPATPGAAPTPTPASVVRQPLSLQINATPSRYNPAMSSTIGIRLVAVNTSGIIPPDAQYTWETTFGTFYHWGPPDFKVVELVPNYTGTADPVYWSYFSEHGEKERHPVVISLTVSDPATGGALGNASLGITWEDPLGFTSVVEGPG